MLMQDLELSIRKLTRLREAGIGETPSALTLVSTVVSLARAAK